MSQLIRNRLYKVVVQNTQSSPTPAPFQQLLTLDLSDVISQPEELLNLRFCADDGCQSPLYAWVESYNSDFSSVYIWVKIPYQIPANSQFPLYVTKENVIQYPWTGMRPDLIVPYGQYDNGQYVFLIYYNGNEPLSNFDVGTNYTLSRVSITMPSGNTGNALNLTGYGSGTGEFLFAYLNKSIPIQSVIAEGNAMLGSNSLQTDQGIAGLMDNNNNGISVVMGLAGSYFAQEYLENGSATATNQQGSAVSEWVYGWLIFQQGSSSWYGAIAPQLYSTSGGYSGTVTTNPITGTQLYSAIIGSSVSSSYPVNEYINWQRVRAYPPNGVMPSLVAFLGV